MTKKNPEKKEPISQHKKSIDKSADKTKRQPGSTRKNIEKTGSEHDDWNDSTGNSHLSSKK